MSRLYRILWTSVYLFVIAVLLIAVLPQKVFAVTRNATYDNEAYAWLDDDAGLNSATGWGSPDTAQNTPIVDIPRNSTTVARLRIAIRQTLTNANAQLAMQPKLQYSSDATSCTTGTWTDVPISTTTTLAFRQASSASFTDNTATTQIVSDGHSFLTGGDGTVGTGTPNSVTFTTTTSEHAEWEWAIVATSNALANQTYRIRAYNVTAGGPFGTYSNCPQLTTLPSFTLVQDHYRWRNDNGSESAATFSDATDATHSNQAINTNVRLRFVISNTGSQADARNYRLQYAVKSGSCGTYADVPAPAGGSDPVGMTATGNYTDQSATTNVSTGGGVTDGTGTFLAGLSVSDTSNQASSYTLTNGRFTELEYNFAFTSNASGGTIYCFRVSRSGIALNTYTNVAEITIASAVTPTTDQLLRHGAWFNSGSEQPYFWAN